MPCWSSFVRRHETCNVTGDDPADIERRLARAADEEQIAEREFDVVVVNDDLDRAVAEVATIVERYRRAGTSS
jgi:guanylate kinase